LPEFVFVRWLDPSHRWALFQVVDTKRFMVVPRSRLIPHTICEGEARGMGITDPNAIVDYCTERNSLFGIPLFRHWLHLTKKGDLMSMDAEEWEKAYHLPPHVDFPCIRDCILRGGEMDLCIANCSSW